MPRTAFRSASTIARVHVRSRRFSRSGTGSTRTRRRLATLVECPVHFKRGQDVNKSYESETTKFIREFLEKNPQVQEKQKKARATWWDRPQDLDQRKRNAESNVGQPGYVYYDKP